MTENKNNSDIQPQDDEQKNIEPKNDNMALAVPEEWDPEGTLAETLQVLVRPGGYKHGLTSNIPVICKGGECPFYATCRLAISGHDMRPIVGKRCPVEIYEIIGKFQWYVDTLGVDDSNIVDLGLIKELVDIDILIDRADRKQAQEVDFLEDVTIGLDERGNEITQRQISKVSEFRDKQHKRKEQILQLLNSTRKDKAGTKVTVVEDPSTHAARLLERKRELEAKGEIIEVEAEDDDKG
jgi:hypothetical protein